MSFLQGKPDFSFGKFTVSWKDAVNRVLVAGESCLVRNIIPVFMQSLDSYAERNGCLFVAPGLDKPFRGNEDKLKYLGKYFADYYGCISLSDDEEKAVLRELSGSLILLITPSTFSWSGWIFGSSAASIAKTLWRRAHIYSFAAFAVLPESDEYFGELLDLCDAFNRFRLCTDAKDVQVRVGSQDKPLWNIIRHLPISFLQVDNVFFLF
ncbi:hypothetical protein Desku_0830 [Desulfofundulus kuznetsovii DSM 6115]|uniref:Uncharacterized protein n=1 Tax=Desulfofundulus kuznetsovii (strain DSM 6115 / VKM B-1805 / 17) TaxID=760568 RepID=A0AAU8P979_DESK7|nr:hypothetical protein Desku_0830 [Desulfofundulus kuznetsovii DSM 6115]